MTCDRCHRNLKAGCWIYSRFTGCRYCTNLDACTRRTRRRGKA